MNACFGCTLLLVLAGLAVVSTGTDVADFDRALQCPGLWPGPCHCLCCLHDSFPSRLAWACLSRGRRFQRVTRSRALGSWGENDMMSPPSNDKTSPNSKGGQGHPPYLLKAGAAKSGWRCCTPGEGPEPLHAISGAHSSVTDPGAWRRLWVYRRPGEPHLPSRASENCTDSSRPEKLVPP